MRKIARAIDALNENTGYYSSSWFYPYWLLSAMKLSCVTASMCTHHLGFEATTFLYGVHLHWVWAIPTKHNGHVIDVFSLTGHCTVPCSESGQFVDLYSDDGADLHLVGGSYAGTALMYREVASSSWRRRFILSRH